MTETPEKKIVIEDRGEVLIGVAKKYETKIQNKSGSITTMYLNIASSDIPIGLKDPVKTGSGMKIWNLHKGCDDFKPNNDAEREVKLAKLMKGEKL